MGQVKLAGARHGRPRSSYRMSLYGHGRRRGTVSWVYYYGAISYPYYTYSSYYYYVLLVLILCPIAYPYCTAVWYYGYNLLVLVLSYTLYSDAANSSLPTCNL